MTVSYLRSYLCTRAGHQRRLTPRRLQIILVLMVWLLGVPAVQAQAPMPTVRFVSDPTWVVVDPNRTFVGFAQRVCANSTSPVNCPSDAMIFGYPAPWGWSANLATLPGATWIWAPGITPVTAPAGLAEFSFSKAFLLARRPALASISIAVDDSATVLVNGVSVGAVGSVTNEYEARQAQSALATFDITSFLVVGTNIITIQVQNGSFGGCHPSLNPVNCSYEANPAGAVFGGVFQFPIIRSFLPMVRR